MSREEFSKKKEAIHSRSPDIIRYSKEKKHAYIKNTTKIVLVSLCIFILGWIGGRSFIKGWIENKVGYSNSSKGIEDEIFNAIQNIAPSLVSISDDEDKLLTKTLEQGNLSGVSINEEGLILTSYSIIKDYEKIFIKTSGLGGKPIEAQLIFSDEDTDIALVKVEGVTLVPPKFIDVNKVKEGTMVLAVGNAVGSEYVGMVTIGIVNSTNQMIFSEETGKNYRLIQVDAKFSPGNYGGVVVNMNGEVIGICSNYLTEEQNDGFYSFIDIETVKDITNNFFIGMDRLGISGNTIEDNKLKGVEGVYIVNVKPGEAAYKAGIKPTDIIVKINDENVRTTQEMFEIVRQCEPGTKITVTILRDGVETNKDIILK